MSKDKLRWGIVGCGDVVFKKSGPSIFAAGRSEIVAVMRRDVEKAKSFANDNDIAVCTDDVSAVIEHEDVDIVYVATPPANHKEYTLAAAKAGKHVLVEKPMGLTAGEDQEMIDACDKAGVQLFTAYYRRFHPHVVKMEQLIDDGILGQIITASINYAQPQATGYDFGWRIEPKVSGGGLFVDVVTHRIDAMIHLLGKPASAVGLTSTFDPASEVEQAATLAIKFDSGVLCSVAGNFATDYSVDQFTITGTKGIIHSERLDGHSFTLRTESHPEPQTLDFTPYPAPHLGLINHIESVLLHGEPNQSSGRDGQLTDIILDRTIRQQ